MHLLAALAIPYNGDRYVTVVVALAISYDGDQYDIQYTSLQRSQYRMMEINTILFLLSIPYNGDRYNIQYTSSVRTTEIVTMLMD